MATHKPLTLLHISDIQVQGAGEERMLETLLHDLDGLTRLYGLAPSVIVASGDLTEHGTATQFNLVSDFLNKAANQLQIETKNVIIVPGNHDIHWPSCEEHFSGVVSPSPPYEKKWGNFATFFTNFYGNSPPNGFEFTLGQPWTLFAVDSIKTVFAGLNSTWGESHLKKDHYGFVGSEQLKWFEKSLSRFKSDEWLRVAVLHHNVLMLESDDSYLKDRQNFFKSILPHVNLVLHGHTHQGVDDAKDGVPIISTGSSTVVAKKRPSEVPNQYQIIQIWPTHYQRWARSYSKTRLDWIGDCSISISGNSWYERKPKRFVSVKKAFHDQIEESSQHANGYLEAGDSASALAIMSRTEKDSLGCFSLKQKFGLYDQSDLMQLDKILELRDGTLDSDSLLDLQIVRLKLHSQEEKFDDVERLYDEITLNPLLKPKKSRGILHRKAIIKAIREGFKKSEPIFLSAIDVSLRPDTCLLNGKPNGHSILTTKVLSAVAKFFCSIHSPDRDEALNLLTSAQENYLTADYEWQIGQAFPVKSVFQTLFAEAAVLLYSNIKDLKGWSRLLAAHLLVSRYVITPRAEGYADILSMIYTADDHFAAKNMGDQAHRLTVRSFLERAMFSDLSKRKVFLDEVLKDHDKYRVLVPMSEIYDLVPFQCPRPNDWQAFRQFLSDHDDRLSIQ